MFLPSDEEEDGGASDPIIVPKLEVEQSDEFVLDPSILPPGTPLSMSPNVRKSDGGRRDDSPHESPDIKPTVPPRTMTRPFRFMSHVEVPPLPKRRRIVRKSSANSGSEAEVETTLEG